MGKQIRDLDDNGKANYVDMYRPPGMVKIKHEYFDAGDEKAVSKCIDPSENTWATQNFGNANVDQAKLDFKKKVEKSIWLAIPSKQMFQR